MVKTLILMCALGMPRDDCNVETALDVIQGPPATNIGQCAFLGQAYVAGTVIGQRGDAYAKVLCSWGDRHKLPAVKVEGISDAD